MTTIIIVVAFMCGRLIPVRAADAEQQIAIARAQAKGQELARIKADAVRAETQKQFEKERQDKIAKREAAQLAVYNARNEHRQKIQDMGLSLIEDYDNWKDIGEGWQVRGVHVRYNYLEYTLRRTDGRSPRLTRIVFEVFDENGQFMFPGVCDISGSDAGITYVRTGDYDLKGKTPTYCRVALNNVGIVKYKNTYPTDR